MPPRDFAKKPAAKPAPAKTGSPVLRAFIVGAFVGVVVGGVSAWKLHALLYPAAVPGGEPANNQGTVQSARVVEDHTPGTKPAAGVKDEKYKSLPNDPQAQADWTLEEILEEKTVAVPKEVQDAAAVPEAPKSYVLACASLSNPEKADAEKARIALQSGLQAQVKSLQSKEGKTLYRVQLGPYNGKREAERDKLKLEQSGINTCRIWGV